MCITRGVKRWKRKESIPSNHPRELSAANGTRVYVLWSEGGGGRGKKGIGQDSPSFVSEFLSNPSETKGKILSLSDCWAPAFWEMSGVLSMKNWSFGF